MLLERIATLRDDCELIKMTDFIDPLGLAVVVSGLKLPPQLRALPLAQFPAVVIGVAWSGKLSNIARQLVAELDAEADRQRAQLAKSR